MGCSTCQLDFANCTCGSTEVDLREIEDSLQRIAKSLKKIAAILTTKLTGDERSYLDVLLGDSD